MLLNNYSVLNSNPGKEIGGFTNLYSTYKSSAWYCYYTGESKVSGQTNNSSFPNGTYPPYSLVLTPTGGSLSSTTLVYSSNTTTANLAGGLNAESTLIQTSNITANATALGNIISTLVQSNVITADIAGVLEAIATLSQTNNLSGDLGAIVGILATLNQTSTITADAIATLPASANLAQTSALTADIIGAIVAASTINNTSAVLSDVVGIWNLGVTLNQTSTLTADLRAIADMVAYITGSNTLTGSNTGTIGSMDCTISNVSVLSPENLAAAVWNSLAISFNNAGSMGEIMNNMGSVADPWSTTIPGSYTSGQAGYVLGNLLSNIPSSVWDELKDTHSTSESYGKIVQDLETLSKQIKSLTAAQL